MNGLKFDSHTEEKAVELFAMNIMKAGEAFILNPMERHCLWESQMDL